MHELVTSFRHAARRLARRPGFTAAAVATLALGIGANVAIFSAVQAVLLEPLPYPEPDRLTEVRTLSDGEVSAFSVPDFIDLREDSDAFSELFATANASLTLSGPTTGDGSQPAELARGYAVTDGFFRVMGVAPAVGQPFTESETRDESDRAVLLGHDLWQRRFGGDPAVVGRRIEVDGKRTTVAGVMPRGFSFPEGAEIWKPLVFDESQLAQRDSHYLGVYGRLAPGVSIQQADTQASAIAVRLEGAYPDSNTGKGFGVVDLREALVGDYRSSLAMLLGAAGLVLLIACANVANLLLARILERRQELAVRSALGAAPAGLLRGILAESVLLAAGGGVAALAVAWAGVELLTSIDTLDVPRLAEATLDPIVLAFGLALTVVTALVAGALPGLRLASARSLHHALVGSRRSTGDRGSHRLRGVLVVAEITLAVVLLFGAGLLARSFLELQQVDPGFNPDGVLTFTTTYDEEAHGTEQRRAAFADRILERLEAIPGVERAGAVLGLPLSGLSIVLSVETLDGAPAYDAPGEEEEVWVKPVTPGYFEALEIPVVAGRPFDSRDRPGGAAAVLINEAAARMLWPGQDAVGHRMEIGMPREDGSPAGGEVIGVVGDVHHHSLARDPAPTLYLPYGELPFPYLTVTLRAAGDPAALAEPVRAAIQEIDPRLAIREVVTMSHLMSETLSQSRLYAALLGLFAATALLLAAVGIYGVVSYAASQRTREMGIRMALGSSRRRVVALMLGQGLGMAAVGAVAGVLAALSLGRVLRSWLYGLGPTDPATLAAAVAILAAVTLLACLAPARRAAQTDPAVTLREE